ncbi:MAG TPA: hypothetical protein VK790_10780 [Solirubrobacteraceae bacterium]|jgi:hypothetical protein|nr:hypothetical protein [Solirubrobacteraceae bacterium]
MSKIDNFASEVVKVPPNKPWEKAVAILAMAIGGLVALVALWIFPPLGVLYLIASIPFWLYKARKRENRKKLQRQLIITERIVTLAVAVAEGGSQTLPGIARSLASEGYVTTHEYTHQDGYEVVLVRPLQRAATFVETHGAEIREHGWDKPQPELLKAVGQLGVYNR